jgi:hypothetical protein
MERQALIDDLGIMKKERQELVGFNCFFFHKIEIIFVLNYLDLSIVMP